MIMHISFYHKQYNQGCYYGNAKEMFLRCISCIYLMQDCRLLRSRHGLTLHRLLYNEKDN